MVCLGEWFKQTVMGTSPMVLWPSMVSLEDWFCMGLTLHRGNWKPLASWFDRVEFIQAQIGLQECLRGNVNAILSRYDSNVWMMLE